ncbi:MULTISPECIES: aldehyde dehydrogenase family protein [Kitasatospora]|uniref:Putative delta-1-pyrroline-5-carboxylate dehydrogenase n=1 Tax=Kitasatospora setae (strain ATCC 33774 / DSM 43861 / JCM 3304 / KCC A-0304 / NBRC 14216 / KM-6054) TaxID=452652 RepID=E4NBX5_KITSK|nr:MULTISPECIES: aldehyde dehydrogenase family protein [Kitasatospora]BAJ28706.1 putative delta-1-pyrroline-5-carboxylate dehydrogenase [Kitasatospora setae KM-6054]
MPTEDDPAADPQPAPGSAPAPEPALGYAPGSAERARLAARLAERAGAPPVSLAAVIGGERRLGGGVRVEVVRPDRRASVLGVLGEATADDARAAVDAALAAADGWRRLPAEERAAVFLRAADLLAGPWRETLVAATMLGQSKSVRQAETDACALADAWRQDAHAAGRLLAGRSRPVPGGRVRAEHRPLDGFVCALTPFHSTAAAGSLSGTPALLGNTVVWRPAPAQTPAAHLTLLLLEEAGLPPGVVNLLPGDGPAATGALLRDPALAGAHFAGPAAGLRRLWREVGANIARYRGHPRIAGTADAPGFLLAHPSADPAAVRTALIRGAFEHQGQGRSALSRAYLPEGLWRRVRDDLLGEVDELPVGDVTDPGTFLGALVDAPAYARAVGAIERAKADPGVVAAAGGQYDDAIGWFVRPTVLLGAAGEDAAGRAGRYADLPGPVLAVRVYGDGHWEEALERAAREAPGGGAVFARDRRAIAVAVARSGFGTGDLRVNGDPSAAPAPPRDPAHWTAARTVRETFIPPTDYVHPHMEWSPE